MKIIDHTKCDTCMSNLMQYLTKVHCIEIKVLYKYLEFFHIDIVCKKPLKQ